MGFVAPPKWRKPVLLILLFLCYLLLTYFPDRGWWLASLGVLLVLGLARATFGGEWFRTMGLALNRRSAVLSLGVFAMLTPLFHFYILQTGRGINVRYVSLLEEGYFIYYFHTLAQVLNEEMVLGGLPLLWLRKMAGDWKSLLVVISLAFAFAGLHYALYAWSPFVSHFSSTRLSTLALTSLVLVGILRSTLILKYQHIGFSFALHLAWNLTFFGGRFLSGERQLDEVERFNAFLGQPLLIVILVVATVAVLVPFLWVRQPRTSTETKPFVDV